MKRLFLACCLTLVATSPTGAAPRDGDWFILTGRNHVVSSDPNHAVVKALQECAHDADENQATLKGLAFTLQEQWTILYSGARGYWVRWSIPPALAKQITDSAKGATAYQCLAFRPQGGWVLLYEPKGFAADGISASARTALEQVRQAGGTFRSFAFTPDGGWLLLLDNDFRAEGLPEDLSRELAEQRTQKVAVRCVTFTSLGDWFLLNERNEYFTSNPAHPVCKQLDALRAQGESLTWLAFSPGEYRQGYVLEQKPVKRIQAVLTSHVTSLDSEVKEWALCAPLPPELDRQHLVKATFVPDGQRLTGPQGRTLVLSRVTGQPHEVRAQLTCELALGSTRLVPRLRGETPVVAELSAEQVALYTSATANEDFTDPTFQEYLDRAQLRRGEQEGDVTFARRAFAYLRQHLQYSTAKMDKRASQVCQLGKSDCAGQSCLLVAVLRANRVPARLLVGRLAESEKAAPPGTDAPALSQHVKAEFFARGVGWIPVDMTVSNSAEFGYFGNDPGYFVAMDLDLPMSVAPFADMAPEPVFSLQGLLHWRRGAVLKGVNIEEHWTVTELSVDVAGSPAPAARAPGGTEQNEDAGRTLPWLLLVPVAGVSLLGLLGLIGMVGLLARKRRRARRAALAPAVVPPAAVKWSCVRCATVVKVLGSQAGRQFRCPVCGTVQTIGP